MKYLTFSLAALAMLAMLTTAQVSSAGLVDGGFESGPLIDDGNGVGKWNPFADGAAGNTSDQGTSMPRTGDGHLDLAIADGNNNGFAGVFQDVPFTGEALFEFKGWHKDNAGTNGAGIEIRFEYRDANGEIGRTDNLTPDSLGSEYEPFSRVEMTPAGTTAVRVVYAIQSFGMVTPQSIFVDDTMATPEPTSLALLGIAGLSVATMRRRK